MQGFVKKDSGAMYRPQDCNSTFSSLPTLKSPSTLFFYTDVTFMLHQARSIKILNVKDCTTNMKTSLLNKF